MLDPLDHHSRDSTLFQFTTKRLRDFIDRITSSSRSTRGSTSRSSSSLLRTTTAATTADRLSTRKCSSERC